MQNGTQVDITTISDIDLAVHMSRSYQSVIVAQANIAAIEQELKRRSEGLRIKDCGNNGESIGIPTA